MSSSSSSRSLSAPQSVAKGTEKEAELAEGKKRKVDEMMGNGEAVQPATEKKQQTYVARLFESFQVNLSKLNATNVTASKVESMSILIHECMSSASRNYHSVRHVFDITENLQVPQEPIPVLAALFHDCIYYTVDGGLSDTQQGILVGCPGAAGTPCVARGEKTVPPDALLHMVETIFGYEQGGEIHAKNGINEFLSAMVAVRQLQDHLSTSNLAKITLCIAATIPFQNKKVVQQADASESSCSTTNTLMMQRIYQNLKKANELFQLQLSNDEMVAAVQQAALLANEDVANFGTSDLYFFLDNTWSLLSETNTSLRSQYLYTIFQYQEAVYKMYGFFGFLKPDMIFASFQNVPSAATMRQLQDRAAHNLEFGKRYVGAKLVSTSVLAAFAVLTGGDAPLCLFMGDLPSRRSGNRDKSSLQLEDLLPPVYHKALDHCDAGVYTVLSQGRRSETDFDIKESPLAAFLYSWIGQENMTQCCIKFKDKMYPMTPENAKELLCSLPKKAVWHIGTNIAQVAVSRSRVIHQLLQELYNTERDSNDNSMNTSGHWKALGSPKRDATTTDVDKSA